MISILIYSDFLIGLLDICFLFMYMEFTQWSKLYSLNWHRYRTMQTQFCTSNKPKKKLFWFWASEFAQSQNDHHATIIPKQEWRWGVTEWPLIFSSALLTNPNKSLWWLFTNVIMLTVSLQFQSKNTGMVAEESQVRSGSEAIIMNCSLRVLFASNSQLAFWFISHLWRNTQNMLPYMSLWSFMPSYPVFYLIRVISFSCFKSDHNVSELQIYFHEIPEDVMDKLVI